ncbi:BZ3500_MvSof-1268-A1-R1_Chr8-2g10271 [Microbotryum saponariae]|uniref:BZ3500_MvSof-1268-A1-R1_Chr8-2g10271 protein n=1 Tax=Microbotryum saponariae TaxID=289078 RepID=A0A2X0KRP2_9BASI|nr:BZ3500_MvSof-1268-A1-R1_Chr8-2g10271 [Microbotryum saponariae]SDA02069.1 BZ3501_MvSof-1269-A2-R1_Chr8-2g10021 [Microbotryum saponariae]
MVSWSNKSSHHQSRSASFSADAGLALVVLALLFASELAGSPLFSDNSAQFSSFKSAGSYTSPLSRCKVEQVIVLERNGANAPDAQLAASLQASLAKVIGKANYTSSAMDFLGKYQYTLGSNGALYSAGAAQSKEAGVQFRKRYCRDGALLNSQCGDHWIRTTDSPALLESAKNWGAGLMQGSGGSVNSPRVISEGLHFNNTLAPQCPNLVSSVPTAQQQWRDVWSPAVIQRSQTGGSNYGLNGTVSECGIRITRARCRSPTVLTRATGIGQDIINFAYMCALESFANGSTSPFCSFFLDSDWPHIEYDGDLGKYYDHSYGARLVQSLGTSWSLELLARLTGNRGYVLKETTLVNKTTDSSPENFPLDRPLYADFASDDQMLAVMSLLNLFLDSALSTTLPCPMRSFITSKMVPFAGRIVFERLSCTGNGFWASIKQTIGASSGAFVRVVVNDEVIDIRHICHEDAVLENGTMCSLESFTAGVDIVQYEKMSRFAQCGFVAADKYTGSHRASKAQIYRNR